MTEADTANGCRYGLYLSPPPESPLHAFASRWLGRHPATGALEPLQPMDGISASWRQAIIDSPRGYGFHATLKAPFHLRPEKSATGLRQALAQFARKREPFVAPPLTLTTIGSFIALTLAARCPAMQELADSCVEEFDEFRRPPGSEELARRRQASLTPPQLALLERWGYPYVFAEWQFHMTLTGFIREPAERALAHARLAPLVEPFCSQPWTVDSVCLFEQAGPAQPFFCTARFPLGGAA